MLYEMYLQFQGRAGARQLKDPRIGMTHNLGGAPRNVSSVAIVGRYGDGTHCVEDDNAVIPRAKPEGPLRP